MSEFTILFNRHGIVVVISWVVVAIIALISAVVICWGLFAKRRRFSELEISETELGIGSQKIKIKPNYQDVQIAYKLWVEVSTRKIGLPIDLEHDVIVEIYNSWYEFFRVTRELIKEIPANKIRSSPSTEKLVRVAVEVLNEGLRPHLTSWQARFRKWYERELKREEAAELASQDLQKGFPKYEELVADMKAVNRRLIHYREVLGRIALEKHPI